MNPHVSCPRFQGETFMLRLVTMEDAPALLRVYSDEAAWPLFNSDNCHGDLFRYTTVERMREAIAFWLASYREGWFVRWAVVAEGAAVGTVEMFRRRAEDAYDGRGILRVDLGSAWERPECIREIVELLLPHAQAMFGCAQIATKVPPAALARQEALRALGFIPCGEALIGHDGTRYGDYWIWQA